MSGAKFTSITGADWKRSLGMARARRLGEVERLGVENAECTNGTCGLRLSCGRYARGSVVRASWPGGADCHGFQPSTVTPPAAA